MKISQLEIVWLKGTHYSRKKKIVLFFLGNYFPDVAKHKKIDTKNCKN